MGAAQDQLAGVSTLDDFDAAGKRVLVRVDFNVPLEDGAVVDDLRIQAALPTIRELLENGAAVILMSHLGRPKGIDDEFRLKPVGARLANLLGRPVAMVDGVVGEKVSQAASALQPGQVLLLENLRFDAREKANDPELARALASLADVYVNDAFGTAHRAAASTVGVAAHLPAYAGRLMERELRYLGSAIDQPERPFVVILGGAKVGDKVGVLDALLPRADHILVGGGMANTFLAAQGVTMAGSLVDNGALQTARRILDRWSDTIVLPVDLVVADRLADDAEHQVIDVTSGVPDGWLAVDIGPRTIKLFGDRIAKARTIVWNGPLGVAELPPFAAGTNAIAEAMAQREVATTIVGGGDSAAAVRAASVADRIDWISTGGGASLELLEGKELPAVAALRRARTDR